MKTRNVLFGILLIFLAFQMGFAQDVLLEPVGLGETMGDFSLKTFQGESVTLSDYQGKKNVLLVFPRGKVMEDLWCPLCYYQYAELAEWEQKMDIRNTYNLEILFVLPYPKDSIQLWREAANGGLSTIERWKHPTGYDTLTGGLKRWADYMREFYPAQYNYPGGVLEISIPVLMDEDKSVSKALYLFTKEWGGTRADQNMPTVFLLDKNGVVQFKYHSQYTNDRPTVAYIEKYIQNMLTK